MALSIPSAASASRSSSAPSVSPWKYDVFLSFRGEDTRKGVVSHIYDELQNMSGIKTFKDDIQLEVGAPISPSLLKAIEDSEFAIVVLSPNYASSAWCLDELKHIFRCMKAKDRILPLFYSVDPSDVRNQRGSFQAAFTIHEKKYKKYHEKVKEWRDALSSVGNLSGWNADKFQSERELVKRIVEDMRRKVIQIPPPIIADLEPSFVSTRLHVPDEISKEVENKVISVGPNGSKKEGKQFDDGVHSAVGRKVIQIPPPIIADLEPSFVSTRLHVPDEIPKEVENKVISVGPYGSNEEGKQFDDGVHSAVRQLVIHHSYKNFRSVKSIQTEYVCDDGNSFWSDRHGRPEYYTEKEIVVLDYPEEFLTSVHGLYDKIWGTPTMISLTFKSNKRNYGPFGRVGVENNFLIEEPGCKIVGFHGKSVNRWIEDPGLRAIGAHLKPINIADLEPSFVSTRLHVPDEISKEVENKVISVGPYGSNREGKKFDDGVHSAVRQLVIHHSFELFPRVQCIQTEYVCDDGNSFWSERHGRPEYGPEKEIVVLDYPEEFLTSVHGRYDKIWGTPTMISLTFKSNKRNYGPFGRVGVENNFSIEEPGCKIVGFHGKSVNRWMGDPGLRAIGAHLKRI